jgi:hypothetical protein
LVSIPHAGWLLSSLSFSFPSFLGSITGSPLCLSTHCLVNLSQSRGPKCLPCDKDSQMHCSSQILSHHCSVECPLEHTSAQNFHLQIYFPDHTSSVFFTRFSFFQLTAIAFFRCWRQKHVEITTPLLSSHKAASSLGNPLGSSLKIHPESNHFCLLSELLSLSSLSLSSRLHPGFLSVVLIPAARLVHMTCKITVLL